MTRTASFQAPESLSEQISLHIGQQIIKGELAPCERIQELKICADLGVSRGPVREALLILERRHLVDILPRKGAMVSSLTPHNVNALYDFYVSLLKMLVTALADTWEEFTVLEPLLEKISGMSKFDDRSPEEVERLLESGFELMHDAAALVDNPYLLEALENLRPAIHRTYYLSMQVRNDGIKNSRHFFNNLAKGVVERDHAFLVKAVHEFADQQRAIVLEVLNESA